MTAMIESKDLHSVMERMGATQSQLSSKTFDMAEKAIAESAVDGVATANARLRGFERQVESTVFEVRQLAASTKANLEQSKSQIDALDNATKRAASVERKVDEKLSQLMASVDSITIKDAALLDAVNVYTLILDRTKQVLGEDALTEAVVVQLLETASYGLWRSIMGPKDSNDRRYR